MKKQVIAYADLETTTVDIGKYKDIKEYYKKEKNPVYPKIYSWCIKVSTKNKNLYKEQQLREMNILYEKIKTYTFEYHTYFGISGKSFIEFVRNLNVDTKIYFNNSKSFDSHFILSELLEAGYKSIISLKDIEKIENEKLKSLYISLKEQRVAYIHELWKSNAVYKNSKPEKQAGLIKSSWDWLFKNEFKMVVNKNNQIYSMGIASDKTYWSGGMKMHRNIQIWDSLLMFTTSIKKMGQDLAEYFFHRQNELPIEKFREMFCKEEISYKRYELYNDLNEFINDGNEKHYLDRDVFILAVFQEMMEQYLPRNEWKLTAASSSYANFMKEYATYYVPKYIKKGIVKKVKVKNGGVKYAYRNQKALYSLAGMGKFLFKKLFPTKWMDEPHREYDTMHGFMYQWYGGGISMVNEAYRGQIVREVVVADINSSYPNQMYSNQMCPYGEGVIGDKKGYDFKFYTMIVINDIHNSQGLPFLYSITDEKREWKKTLKAGDIIKLTSPEYEYFLKYYDSKPNDYILKTEMSFKEMPLKNIFGMYIDKWYPLKQKASADKNTVLKAIVKLFLNSLYGKYGTKTILESKIFNSYTGSWEAIEEKLKSKYYLPIAIAITTYARLNLVRAVHTNYKNFVYCDTDSIFMVNFDKCDFSLIEFDKTKLGAFDIEAEHLTGLARRSKQYYFIQMNGDEIYLKNGKPKKKVAFAGINFNRDWLSDEDAYIEENADKIVDKLEIRDFIVGKEINNQLQPHRIVSKGIVLYETVKSIKPIWEYKALSEQIYRKEGDFIEALKIAKKLKI